MSDDYDKKIKRVYNHTRYLKHKEKLKENARAYYYANKEKALARYKKRSEAHKEQLKEYRRQYYLKNLDHMRERAHLYQREYNKKKKLKKLLEEG